MKLEDIVKSEGIWRYNPSEKGTVVLKSSIIFRRNIAGNNFVSTMPKNKRDRLFNNVVNTVMEEDYCSEYSLIPVDRLKRLDQKILEERDIIDKKRSCKYLVLSTDERSYFLVGNSDHLTLILNNPGYMLEDLKNMGEHILWDLKKNLNYAFSREFGYLTSEPALAGPGFQMVLTCHLLGLTTVGTINELITDLRKDGFTVRGSWINDYYSIFNTVTLGYSSEELYNKTIDVFNKIIDMEERARERIYKLNRDSIEDRIWRSIGILSTARVMPLFEALDLLSKVRFGIGLDIIKKPSIKELNSLLYFIQDGHLIKRFGLIEDEYDDRNLELLIEENRANLIRNHFKEVA